MLILKKDKAFSPIQDSATLRRRLSFPEIAKLTITGPTVVPTLFIPPAKLNLCEPFFGLPILMTSGFAAVC